MGLKFERNSRWWIENITHAEVTTHRVVMRDQFGDETRVSRLLLPSGLERALHVGQFSTRELGLQTVVTPFARTFKPLASRRRPRHVVVWAEFAVRSRIALWWACASFPSASVWVVPIPRNRPAWQEVFGHRDAGELMTAAPGIRRLTSRQTARFAANWKAWQQGDARFRPVDLPAWPADTQWVGNVPNPIFELFPRLGDAPTLSPYDVEVLELLSSEWSTERDVLRKLLRGPDLHLLNVWGDTPIRKRVHTWSRWMRGRFVESRPFKSADERSKFEYRLTDEGRELLNGLPSLDAAPPFSFGGFTFYTPGSWVITSRGPRRVRR